MATQGKFGARVFLMDSDVILIMQTVKRGTLQNSRYVVDQKPKGEGQKFVDFGDDAGLADTIRSALQGRL